MQVLATAIRFVCSIKMGIGDTLFDANTCVVRCTSYICQHKTTVPEIVKPMDCSLASKYCQSAYS